MAPWRRRGADAFRHAVRAGRGILGALAGVPAVGGTTVDGAIWNWHRLWRLLSCRGRGGVPQGEG